MVLRDQLAIPCLFMRGGTSRGPFFLARDLPADPARRDRVLLAAMGSPDKRQIDGLGGATTLTSKAVIVQPSARADSDVDFLFAQVDIERALVDTTPSCGNMLAGVGPFAIETSLVAAAEGTTRVRIFNMNTQSRVEAIIETPDKQVAYDGQARIDGVPGTAAPILLNFADVVGSVTGSMLPTGKVRDTIDGVELSCIDVAMPMILLRARDFGLTGTEGREAIEGDQARLQRIEALRRKAGLLMGMGDVADKVVPKVGILSEPHSDGGTISSRYLTPHALHAAHAVTGAVCVASACALAGSLAHEMARPEASNPRTIWIEHPSGMIDVVLTTRGEGAQMDVTAGTLRTARLIMRGEVMVPRRVFAD